MRYIKLHAKNKASELKEDAITIYISLRQYPDEILVNPETGWTLMNYYGSAPGEDNTYVIRESPEEVLALLIGN